MIQGAVHARAIPDEEAAQSTAARISTASWPDLRPQAEWGSVQSTAARISTASWPDLRPQAEWGSVQSTAARISAAARCGSSKGPKWVLSGQTTLRALGS